MASVHAAPIAPISACSNQATRFEQWRRIDWGEALSGPIARVRRAAYRTTIPTILEWRTAP